MSETDRYDPEKVDTISNNDQRHVELPEIVLGIVVLVLFIVFAMIYALSEDPGIRTWALIFLILEFGGIVLTIFFNSARKYWSKKSNPDSEH